jgi:Asp-tRNA(Asn)/Glu-tRNA(Gln) amidotransferase C subunit|tara:strand:- start:460 stop:687 length:228 start_codon:yes stop_codon:yes gene_type:complete
MDRIEIKAMMDKKERMDMIRKFAAIRNGIEETRRIDTNGERWTYSAVKQNTIMRAYKNYCRESWLYRLLEKIGLR